MKKILCFLGIIGLLVLTFLPPVLRVVMKDKKTEEVVKKESGILFCSNLEYVINTSYQNDKIQMIVIKKINTIPETDSNNNLKSESELDQIFDNLKKQTDLIYNEEENGETIAIDFSVSDHDTLDLSKITNNIEKQKNYYESQNLTCSVRK